jgi:sulfite exporter TauE/SafE
MKPHLLYNLGRATTYSLIGGAAGLVGSFLGVAAALAPFQKAVTFGAGALVVLLGLSLGGWLPRLSAFHGSGDPPGLARRILRFAGENGGDGVFYPVGLVLGFLPCGLVYAALLAAAKAGMDASGPAEAFLRGFLGLAAFGAGTMPALLLIGKAAAFLGPRMRAGFSRASAALVILAGAVFIARALLD